MLPVQAILFQNKNQANNCCPFQILLSTLYPCAFTPKFGALSYIVCWKGAHFHEPQLDQDPMDRRLLVYYLQIIPEMWTVEQLFFTGIKPLTTEHTSKVQLVIYSRCLVRWSNSWTILTLYTLTSVCIFSILFSIHFLRCWQGEFV